MTVDSQRHLFILICSVFVGTSLASEVLTTVRDEIFATLPDSEECLLVPGVFNKNVLAVDEVTSEANLPEENTSTHKSKDVSEKAKKKKKVTHQDIQQLQVDVLKIEKRQIELEVENLELTNKKIRLEIERLIATNKPSHVSSSRFSLSWV